MPRLPALQGRAESTVAMRLLVCLPSCSQFRARRQHNYGFKHREAWLEYYAQVSMLRGGLQGVSQDPEVVGRLPERSRHCSNRQE